jgi:hypothetical protein
MNDDWALFITVSILMLSMLTFCMYLQDIALVKKDWANLKCNPLYMFLNSITADDKSSIDNFKNCVVNV